MSFKGALLESRTNQLLQWSISFLEGSISDSRLIKSVYQVLIVLYPQRLYEALDRLNGRQQSYLSKNIFSPILIFHLVYALFISLSDYRISNLALATVGSGLFFFFAAFKLSNFTFREIKLNEDTKRVGIFFFAIGLLFLLFDLFTVQSIPLFNPSARSRLVVLYTMIAQLIPPGGVFLIAFLGEKHRKGELDRKKARVYAFSVFFASLILISTLGFRTQIIVTLLGSFIAMYLTGLVGFVEVLITFALAAFGIVFLGYVRAVIQGSPIGFFDDMRARVGLTMSVYDFLVRRFMPFGANKGYTFLASFSSFIPGLPGPRLGPRTIVARLFEITGVSVTSTLLGTVVLDLGIIGVVMFMFALGHILGAAYRAAKTGFAMGVGIYSVLLAYSLVGIETGLVDFNVLMMFFFGYVLLRRSATA